MSHHKTIKGFSKLNKRGKIKWIAENFFSHPDIVMRELMSYWLTNADDQKVLDGISENTISNFPLPFSVAPNFIINDTAYCVPRVIEESSVVAAASSAAKYWRDRGGFKTTVLNTIKVGQIHLRTDLKEERLRELFNSYYHAIIDGCKAITSNMEARGGGVLAAELISFVEESGYYQIRFKFETCDSMGANFINSFLETFAQHFQQLIRNYIPPAISLEIIMCILSNYTPEGVVRAEVSCPVEALGVQANGMKAEEFADKFAQAARIAHIDPYRAVTHNKGIFNGIDAVILATGNDFRAIEACAHAYAARDGQYRSLSSAEVRGGVFRFWLDMPLAIGTVGGLTKLHPVAKRSLEMLGHPGARELMGIVASVGLAQNFAALRSLVTTGIQQGHMKMHLTNVLYQLKATEREFMMAVDHFKDKIVSHSAVRDFLDQLRRRGEGDVKNA